MMLERCFFLLSNFEGFKTDNSFLFTVSNFENNTFSTTSVLVNLTYTNGKASLWDRMFVFIYLVFFCFLFLLSSICNKDLLFSWFQLFNLLKATMCWNRGNHLIWYIFIIFVAVFYTTVKIISSSVLCSIPYFVIIYIALKETIRPVFFCIEHC